MRLTESVRADLLALPRNEWPLIAESADVPLSTLMKVAYEATKTHRSDTVEKLAAALQQRKTGTQ